MIEQTDYIKKAYEEQAEFKKKIQELAKIMAETESNPHYKDIQEMEKLCGSCIRAHNRVKTLKCGIKRRAREMNHE